MSLSYDSGQLTRVSAGQISRTRFERLLLLRLDKVRVGTGQNVKRLIGSAWRTIIDEMYARNAERLSVNEFGPAVTECADAIFHVTKSLKP